MCKMQCTIALVVSDAQAEGKVSVTHECHFGIQRIKQLARIAVYWPNIDSDILDQCRHCSTCAEHESEPSKAAVHPWMLPEKPWSRLHIDHAINFLGFNWLVVTDAYTKYPCNHATQSVSAKSTIKLLQEDFAHFGFPHTVITDCAATFKSEEFQEFSKENGIVHLTGAPYHPAINGAAERLVQTFKQALKKSDKAPRDTLQDFLRNYRRTPLSTGYSPSKLLNGRQMRTKIDTLLPSPAHTAQGKQAREATKSQQSERQLPVTQVSVAYKVGDPCYALLDHDVIATLDGCLPLLSNVLGPAVSTCVWFREIQSGDATSIYCNDVTFRQMTQNLVMLPGCPKAEKRPLRFRAALERHFDSDHRATAYVTKR